MKLLFTKILILGLLLVPLGGADACNVTPSLSYASSHTCGLPTIIKAYNTSTGTYKTRQGITGKLIIL